MNSPLLIALGMLACGGDKQPLDTADTGPLGGSTRDRMEGELALAEVEQVVWGTAGDEVGTAAVGGRSWALAVGAPQRDDGLGVVGVFSALPSGEVSVEDADVQLEGWRPGGYAGATLCAFGDAGLAVGAFWDGRGGEEAGAVSLYADPLSDDVPAAVWIGRAGDFAAISIAALGDVDGDGAPELAVGGHGADIASNDEGVVAVISTASQGEGRLIDAPWGVWGDQTTGWLGIAVAGGDLNGDGVGDLIAGAMGREGLEASSGTAHAFFGPLAGWVAPDDADLTLLGEASWSQYGKAVASGKDIDGDGLDDLLVSAPELNGGAVYLYLGGLDGELEAWLAEATFTAEGPADRAGFSVDLVDDRDGDGFGEVLIGATRYSPSDEVFAAGAAYLVYGPHQGGLSLGLADWRLRGASENARAGIEVVDAGDLDGDGFPELLIGARGEPLGEAEGAGALYILP